MNKLQNYLGIDVGDARIGLALANSIAKIPSPYAVLPNGPGIFEEIKKIISQEDINQVIVGLPRDQQGLETGQSIRSRDFGDKLVRHTSAPIVLADESLSSIRATVQKVYRGTSKKHLDDVAACYILEEFFNHQEAGQ